ncbi:MAG: hypothetical protein NVS3B20_18740 [Polyangiales bacterium]
MRPSEKLRVAKQIELNIEVKIDVIGRPSQQLTPAPTAQVSDEIVAIPTRFIGQTFRGTVSNLTPTGAAIAADEVLPLLSRVALTFELDGGVTAIALGLVMWRRTAELAVPRDDAAPLVLKPGYGVLFEALSDRTRQAINELIAKRGIP